MLTALEEKKGKRFKRRHAHSKFSKKLGNFVVGKPWTVIILSVAILGGLALFSPKIQYTQNLLESFPKDMPSREGFTLMAEHFSSGELAPVQVIVDTEGKDLNLQGPLNELSFVNHVSEPRKGKKDANYHSFDVILKNDPYDEKSVETIPILKKQVSSILAASSIDPDNHYWIGGRRQSFMIPR